MKKLTKSDMKKLVGGILYPPVNGYCYQLGENCDNVSQCCPPSYYSIPGLEVYCIDKACVGAAP